MVSVTDTVSAQSVEQISEYERKIEEQQRQLDEMRRELEALKAALSKQQDTHTRATTNQADEGNKFVLSKNENLKLMFSGRVHRMLLNVDDGLSTNSFLPTPTKARQCCGSMRQARRMTQRRSARRLRLESARTDHFSSARTALMVVPTLQCVLPRYT